MDKVTIVGVGALGSHLALFLRNHAQITVIDFDRVEQKNTMSQMHPKSTVRKNKAQSMVQTMNFLFGIKLKGVPHKVTEDNVAQLLDGDLLIDCMDNGEGRRVMQAYARVCGRPLLHGALARNGEFGRVIWDENFQIDYEDGTGGATCEDGDFLPFIAVVSSYLASAAQTYLKDGKRIGYQIYPTGATRV